MKYGDRDCHSLMLDLDSEHDVLESSTSGHHHLVFNTRLKLDEVIEILTVLNKYGIIQTGVLESTKKRGFTSIRVPGVNKYAPEDNAGFYDEDIVPKKDPSDPFGVKGFSVSFTSEVNDKVFQELLWGDLTDKDSNTIGLENKKENENEPQD